MEIGFEGQIGSYIDHMLNDRINDTSTCSFGIKNLIDKYFFAIVSFISLSSYFVYFCYLLALYKYILTLTL